MRRSSASSDVSGEVKRKLNVEGIRVSKGAKVAIEKAGGSVAELVEESRQADQKQRPPTKSAE